jgi:FkbM family methyltransferase
MRLDPSLVHLDWEHVEERAYRVYQQAIQPSAIIYDIGAHIGTYSYIGAKTGGANTRIVAYEPCALTRFFLTQHLQWNEVAEQVEFRDCACGSQSGRYAFFIHPDEPDGRNSFIPSEGFEEHQVEVTTLDQEVNKLQLAPDLIKIDVEGFEFEVLKGAQHVLHDYSPNLLLSLHPELLHKLGSNSESILDWLSVRGYNITKISQDHEIHIFATSSTRRAYSSR